MQLLIGTTGFHGPRRRFPADRLGLVELEESFESSIKPDTLAGWRDELTHPVRWIVRGHRDITFPRPGRSDLGHFRDTEQVRDAWARTVQITRTLDTAAVLLRTPPSFTPTQEHRSAMAAFLERGKASLGDTTIVWEPRGIWDEEEVLELCLEHNLVAACDPLRSPPGPGPVAFCRLLGRGGSRNRYDQDDLLDILSVIGERNSAMVVFDHPRAVKDALAMTRLCNELPDD